MFFNETMETLPLEKLKALQSERLVAQVQHTYKHVAAYRQKLDEAGISPADIKGIDDISKLPFTKKTDLRDNYPFGLFAVPREEIVRLHCSSGTTGKPIVVGYTQNDIDVFAEVVARSLHAAGGRKGMVLQNAYGYGLFTGGLGIHYGGEKLGMAVLPISGGNTEKQISLMQDFGSEVITCTPSYALALAEFVERHNIPLSSLNLKYAILGAEPWTESIRKEIEARLHVSATNIYGLSEIIGPGVSQEDIDEKGTGSYIWEDHFYPEVVDRHTGEPLPEGEDGVLVFSTLTKKGMPMLRYWTNDITCLHRDKGSKRTFIKMDPIKGRADDMLIIRGVNLFHTQVEAVLEEIEGLSNNYQLIVTNRGIMDEVEVRVELSPELYEDMKPQIDAEQKIIEQNDYLKNIHFHFGKKIKDIIGLTMKITLVASDAIPRSEGGKLNRIIDKRKEMA